MMKEIEGFSIEHHLNAEKKIESKFIGQVLLKPGQRMWSYNLQTDDCKEVTLRQTQLRKGVIKHEKGAVYMPDQTYVDMVISRASFDPRLLYCVAINRTNAAKKFATILFNLSKQQAKKQISSIATAEKIIESAYRGVSELQNNKTK